MKGPIRVLHVFASMNRGGAETMLMNIYREIDRNKLQFDFMVHTDLKCAYDDEISALGGRIFRVPRFTGENYFEYKKAWTRFFDQHSKEYIVIHGHNRSIANIYLKIAKRYGLTTIVHSHSTSSGGGLQAVIKFCMQYRLRYQTDYLFACSKKAGEWLYGKKALSGDRFYIIKNAINTEDYFYNSAIRDKVRTEFAIENKFVVGHVGRFHESKNHSFLLLAFQEICKQKSNAVLMLVGDGPLRGQIEAHIQNLHLTDKVILTGVREDVPDLLQAMDCFVFPSLYEGLGIVAIEAQAAGLPCILSDAVPQEAHVTDLTKVLSLTESPKIWAAEICSVTLPKDRGIYSDIVRDAGYDVSQTSKWLVDFYIERGR